VVTHRINPKNEIVTGCIDTRELKLFLATVKGKIFTMSIKNGAKMRKYQNHKDLVTDIVCWASQQVFV
jgi:hypothetical protein